MNQVYKIGDQVLIYKVGTIVGAQWDKVRGAVTYDIRFDDDLGLMGGFATMTDNYLTPPAAQVLKDAEITELNDRGIMA